MQNYHNDNVHTILKNNHRRHFVSGFVPYNRIVNGYNNFIAVAAVMASMQLPTLSFSIIF